MARLTSKDIEDIIDNKLNPIYKKIDEIYPIIDIDKITNSFIDTANHIYEYISLYYVYYKLNLNGVKDFDYEFRSLENKLYNDLYYMNYYMIVDKMYMFIHHFKVYDVSKKELISIKDIENSDEILPTILSCIENIDVDFIIDIMDLGTQFTKTNIDYSFNQEDIIDLSKFVEEEYKWFSRPDIFIPKANDIIMAGGTNLNKTSNLICGFEDSFVYPYIFNYLSLRNYSKTLSVDIGFSTFHNDLSMVQKIFFNMVVEGERNKEMMKLIPKLHSESGIEDYVALFEQVKEDNFDNVYEIAKAANPRLQSYKYRSIILEN